MSMAIQVIPGIFGNGIRKQIYGQEKQNLKEMQNLMLLVLQSGIRDI